MLRNPKVRGNGMTAIPDNFRVKKLAIHIGARDACKVDAMLRRQNLAGMDLYQRSLPHGAVGHLGVSPLPTKGNACFSRGLSINGPDSTHIVDADTVSETKAIGGDPDPAA